MSASLLLLCLTATGGDDERPTSGPTAATATAATAAVLARADAAYLRSTVRPNDLKGAFVERYMRDRIAGHLRLSGAWQPLRSRLGPQGIDGLHVKFDDLGRPRGLLLSEAKAWHSRLKMTRDGLQLSPTWRAARLAKLGSLYGDIGRAAAGGSVAVGRAPSSARQRLQVPLKDGRAAVFWRPDPRSPWVFAGPADRLAEAAGRMTELGRYLDAAADGRIDYRARLFRMRLNDGLLDVAIYDAAALPADGSMGSVGRPERSFRIRLSPGELAALGRLGRAEIAEHLVRSANLTTAEAELYAAEMVRRPGDLEELLNRGGSRAAYARTVVTNSAVAGAVGAALDVTIAAASDYFGDGRIRLDEAATRAAVAFASAGGGAYTGQEANVLLLRGRVVDRFAPKSWLANVRSGRVILARAGGGLVGGPVGALIYSYGGYFAGLHDATTANRTAFAGVAGGLAGYAAVSGATALVATFGTASTGTAISGLSGAAATGATTAWFGGGSLAAGGLGVAGGTAVLTGGAALVAAGVTIAVMEGIELVDKRSDRERVRLTLERLAAKKGYLPENRVLGFAPIAP